MPDRQVVEHLMPARAVIGVLKAGGWLEGDSLALPHGLGRGWTAVLVCRPP